MSDMTIWKNKDLSRSYLDGVRGAIPFANAQIEMMQRFISKFVPSVDRFLDLGCGDGILGYHLLNLFPNSQGLFLDFSPEMLSSAQERLASFEDRAGLINFDYGRPEWVTLPEIAGQQPFDVILSGFSIHHQPDERKREIYAEIHALLRPGGVFMNLEHVSSPTREIETLFEDQFIDSLAAYHAEIGSGKDRAQVASEYYHRPDKGANILLDVETQCRWLRDIGFEQVDCYFKSFELALFGGVKPSD